MSIYDCDSCRKDRRCAMQNDYARASLFAFGRRAAIPECPWYQADQWKGVEGVLNVHHADFRGHLAG